MDALVAIAAVMLRPGLTARLEVLSAARPVGYPRRRGGKNIDTSVYSVSFPLFHEIPCDPQPGPRPRSVACFPPSVQTLIIHHP